MSPCLLKFPKFLRQNHDPKDICLQEGLIFVSLFDHVYGPIIRNVSIISSMRETQFQRGMTPETDTELLYCLDLIKSGAWPPKAQAKSKETILERADF